MRTTLTIDEDVLSAARSLAQNRSVSIGKVISQLARKGLQCEVPIAEKNGLPVFLVSKEAKPITLEQVKQDDDWP